MFLVDTNVVSELTRRKPNPGVLRWMSAHPTFALSAVTIEELVYGIERSPAAQRRGLSEWLEEYSIGELWLKNVLGGHPREDRFHESLMKR